MKDSQTREEAEANAESKVTDSQEEGCRWAPLGAESL
jgi:hypothetical protein